MRSEHFEGTQSQLFAHLRRLRYKAESEGCMLKFTALRYGKDLYYVVTETVADKRKRRRIPKIANADFDSAGG